MTTTIPRAQRAWAADDYYKRDQQLDAEGWHPEDTREPGLYEPECPCGSGLAVEDDGGCVCCWFSRTEGTA